MPMIKQEDYEQLQAELADVQGGLSQQEETNFKQCEIIERLRAERDELIAAIKDAATEDTDGCYRKIEALWDTLKENNHEG